MQGNIANHISEKVPVSRMYKEQPQLNYKTTNPIFKTDKELEYTFLQNYTNVQKTHEEMFMSLAIRKMQIESTRRYSLRPTGWWLQNKSVFRLFAGSRHWAPKTLRIS